jgi:hypothetical protein
MKVDLHIRPMFFVSRYAIAFSTFVFLSAFFLQDENASGKLTYKGKSKSFDVALKHAYFISGPDTFDHNKIIRRLIISDKNLVDRINTCTTMRCPDQYMDGIQLDLDAAKKVLYWVVLDNQKVQYSGTAVMEALELTTNTAEKIAGKIKIDDSAAGGPTLDVTFDASLLKAYTKYE